MNNAAPLSVTALHDFDNAVDNEPRVLIPLPEALLRQGWKAGDTLTVSLDGTSLQLRNNSWEEREMPVFIVEETVTITTRYAVQAKTSVHASTSVIIKTEDLTPIDSVQENSEITLVREATLQEREDYAQLTATLKYHRPLPPEAYQDMAGGPGE